MKPVIESRSPIGKMRPCTARDLDSIYQIINEAAKAYKPAVPSHAYHEPQMSMDELEREMRRVIFLAYEENDTVLGIMGYEFIKDATLIRHAYIRPESQRKGIGSILLKQIEDVIATSSRVKKIIIGTYIGASWAISFYEKHGYQKSSRSQEILSKYYDIPEAQRLNSLTLEKAFA